MNLLCEAALNVLDCAGQVAVAHAEFDGDKTPAILAVNHECAFAERNVGYLAERDIIPIGSGKQNISDSFGSLAKLWLVTNDEIEAAIAFQNLRCRYATNGRLH